MESHHNDNSAVCSYLDPMAKETYEDANAPKVCGYSDSGESQCEVGTGDEIIQ